MAGQFAASRAFRATTNLTLQGQVVHFIFTMQSGADFVQATEMIVLRPSGQVQLVDLSFVEREGSTQVAFDLQATTAASEFFFREAGLAGSTSLTLHS